MAHLSQVSKRTVFDQRLRHISEITVVDSLLDAMGLKAHQAHPITPSLTTIGAIQPDRCAAAATDCL